jgi:uncharacterized protein YeaO (DUF488 family)
MKLLLKRAYEAPGPKDGYRVLVDRVWPRGVSRDTIKIDLWLKEVAPSTQLRKWFAHDVDNWSGFKSRYRRELRKVDAELDVLREQLRHGPVTLVYGARDEIHNQAVVLRDYLLKDNAK